MSGWYMYYSSPYWSSTDKNHVPITKHVHCNIFNLLFKLAYIIQLHREVDITPIKLLRLCSVISWGSFLTGLSTLLMHHFNNWLPALLTFVSALLPLMNSVWSIWGLPFNFLYFARWMLRDITLWNLQVLPLWLNLAKLLFHSSAERVSLSRAQDQLCHLQCNISSQSRSGETPDRMELIILITCDIACIVRIPRNALTVWLILSWMLFQ